jgi:hypothetical protein
MPTPTNGWPLTGLFVGWFLLLFMLLAHGTFQETLSVGTVLVRRDQSAAPLSVLY